MPVARRVAERLIEAFGSGARSRMAGTANAQVSIGVAAGHPGSGSADELLRNADVAMYSAKARGKNRVAFFEPEMATAVAARHTLTESLQRAVAAEEFVLHYQPIFEVATGRMTGRRVAGPLDAPDAGHGLAGRIHPDGGGVGPDPRHRPLGARALMPAGQGVARPLARAARPRRSA